MSTSVNDAHLINNTNVLISLNWLNYWWAIIKYETLQLLELLIRNVNVENGLCYANKFVFFNYNSTKSNWINK